MSAPAERQSYQGLNEPGRTPGTFPLLCDLLSVPALALTLSWDTLGRHSTARAGFRWGRQPVSAPWPTLPGSQTQDVLPSRTTPRRDSKRKISSSAINGDGKEVQRRWRHGGLRVAIQHSRRPHWGQSGSSLGASTSPGAFQSSKARMRCQRAWTAGASQP